MGRSSEKVHSNMRKMRRYRSSCARAKHYPGLCSRFIYCFCELLLHGNMFGYSLEDVTKLFLFVVANDSVSGHWRSWSGCADAHADLSTYGRRHVFHGATHIKWSLRKHAYSNILKILSPKQWIFSDKKFWYFSYFCSKHRLRVIYVFEQK